ncbi:uncharacterized protein EV420DRAFT_1748413 [Desarmillaria tabescens]|uniref:Uncharacterized protein n=1 Tax=Armillaria tabescens TaxID=1929756 RepID=A0AA39KC81_ARMTA|nr:uncharacterized protein EV420DRAFT_1748413 [Desarmillaria tabescens]KAK0458123.1 hypothetical protein EV420DRAFT_1748413 [Desarmillaria tabescens]
MGALEFPSERIALAGRKAIGRNSEYARMLMQRLGNDETEIRTGWRSQLYFVFMSRKGFDELNEKNIGEDGAGAYPLPSFARILYLSNVLELGETSSSRSLFPETSIDGGTSRSLNEKHIMISVTAAPARHIDVNFKLFVRVRRSIVHAARAPSRKMITEPTLEYDCQCRIQESARNRLNGALTARLDRTKLDGTLNACTDETRSKLDVGSGQSPIVRVWTEDGGAVDEASTMANRRVGRSVKARQLTTNTVWTLETECWFLSSSRVQVRVWVVKRKRTLHQGKEDGKSASFTLTRRRLFVQEERRIHVGSHSRLQAPLFKKRLYACDKFASTHTQSFSSTPLTYANKHGVIPILPKSTVRLFQAHACFPSKASFAGCALSFGGRRGDVYNVRLGSKYLLIPQDGPS